MSIVDPLRKGIFRRVSGDSGGGGRTGEGGGGVGRVVSFGSAEDQGHQISHRRRRPDQSDNDGLSRYSALGWRDSGLAFWERGINHALLWLALLRTFALLPPPL